MYYHVPVYPDGTSVFHRPLSRQDHSSRLQVLFWKLGLVDVKLNIKKVRSSNYQGCSIGFGFQFEQRKVFPSRGQASGDSGDVAINISLVL